MRTLLIFLAILILSGGVFAQAPGQHISNQEIWTEKANDGKLNFKIYQAYSDMGERRVIYELVEGHYFFRDTKIIVLIGQDFDFDGKIDAWFPASADGYGNIIYKKSESADGWDVAKGILIHESKVTERTVLELVYRNFMFVFSDIGIFSNLKQYRDNHDAWILKSQLELLTSEARFVLMGPHSVEEKLHFYDGSILVRCKDEQKARGYSKCYEKVAHGLTDQWQEQLDKINSAYWGSVWRYLKDYATDVLPLAFSLKWAAKLIPGFVKNAGARFMTSKMGYLLTPIFESLKLSMKAKIARLPNALKILGRGSVVAIKATGKNLKRLDVAAHSKGFAASRYVARVAASGNPMKSYIPILVTANISGAIASNWDAVKGTSQIGGYNVPNPFKIGLNIATNPEIMYAISYQIWDGMVQNKIHGLYSGMGRSGMGYVAAGFFSLVDSIAMTTVFEFGADVNKGTIQKVIDTTFQVSFGNVGARADDFIESYFKNLMLTSGNTKWRIVGWLGQLGTGAVSFGGYEYWNRLLRELQYDLQTWAGKKSEESIKRSHFESMMSAGTLRTVVIPVMVPVY